MVAPYFYLIFSGKSILHANFTKTVIPAKAGIHAVIRLDYRDSGFRRDDASDRMPSMTPSPLERYRENLQGEIDAAAMYRALAGQEENQATASIYLKLAAIEDKHAVFWRGQVVKAGGNPDDIKVSARTRAMIWLGKTMGAGFVLPSLVRIEGKDSNKYYGQDEVAGSPMPREEQSHANVLKALSKKSGAGMEGSSVAKFEKRHFLGGNELRAAVLGANDGLVSNLSLVMGVAGAAVSSQTILLTGLAGLMAGACSMAMGEWLSVNSSRELHQKQIDREREELEHNPEEEKQELILIYQAKGLSETQAADLANRLMQDKDQALNTLVREELGIDPAELGGSAWTAAVSSFFLFAVGAVFPVAPFLFMEGQDAILASLLVSGLGLLAIGTGTALFTGRGFLFSGIRQLLIGYAAAALTFAVGTLFGVSLSG